MEIIFNQCLPLHTLKSYNVQVKEDPDTISSPTDVIPESELSPVDDAMDPATDVIIESLIGEAEDDVVKSDDIAQMLKLDLNQNFASDFVTSTSDTSPPSTPNSARSLKSALRRVRRYQHSKSVSFSEDVEVEVLVSPGKTKKGKPRPLVAKRRIERLKTESKGRRRRYHSDSEVSYNPSGGSEFYMEDFEEDFKRMALSESKRTRNRHSSSESESGQDERNAGNKGSPSGSSSKKSRRQRKKQQKGKRVLNFDEPQGKRDDSQESGDNMESPSSGGPKGKIVNGTTMSAQNIPSSTSKDDVGKLNGKSGSPDDVKRVNGALKEENQDEVPLEYQDHRTKSDVAFQNEVMFELDD